MIKKHIKKTLENLNFKNIYFNFAPDTINDTYIVYSIINETGAFYYENKEMETQHIVQVDIFSNGDYSILESKVKKCMLDGGFDRINGYDLYETKTKLYHKVMRFSITLHNKEL